MTSAMSAGSTSWSVRGVLTTMVFQLYTHENTQVQSDSCRHNSV
jgi:hypothetical protein